MLRIMWKNPKWTLQLLFFWPVFFALFWDQPGYLFFSHFLSVFPTCLVTPAESSKTWGRNSVLPKEEGEEEEKRGQKKKGRTWGPSSLCHKELGAGEDGWEERAWNQAGVQVLKLVMSGLTGDLPAFLQALFCLQMCCAWGVRDPKQRSMLHSLPF